MNLEQVYYVSQIVAVMAIIISLVFVGFQVRQNTEQMKRARRDTMLSHESVGFQMMHNYFLAVAIHPELSDFLAKARSDISNFSEAERQRFTHCMLSILIHTQFGYLNLLRGFTDELIWRAHSAEIHKTMSSPGCKAWWQQSRSMFLPVFRDYVDGLTGLGPLQYPGLPDQPVSRTAADRTGPDAF